MAKVKNQVYDGSEEDYVDEDGTSYGEGEFHRHAVTDAYPLPSTGSEDVVRKSPRGYRKTQQGDGSPEQLPIRECWQQCSDLWNSLPAECPACGGCLHKTSKASVWADKSAHGTLSSYYDHFMGCCMATCTKITLLLPDGVRILSGAIDPNLPCWPCVPNCQDSVLEIQCSTYHMQAGETQTLTAHYTSACGVADCGAPEDFTWILLQGGGILSSPIGYSVNYTAPLSNPDCSVHPIIQLIDPCDKLAQLNLSFNAYMLESDAYQRYAGARIVRTGDICGCASYVYSMFNCDDTYRRPGSYYASDDGSYCPADDPTIGQACTCGICPPYTDARSGELIAAGCCPSFGL